MIVVAVVYRVLRFDQVSRQMIRVISPEQKAEPESDQSLLLLLVSQILCPSAYDCFKLHLLSTCLSIKRNHLISDRIASPLPLSIASMAVLRLVAAIVKKNVGASNY